MSPERGTSVDSNVLLDLFTGDPTWGEWSAARLVEAFDRGPVVINQVVHGEVSLRFTLLTRDAARYRTCYPTVRLVAP